MKKVIHCGMSGDKRSLKKIKVNCFIFHFLGNGSQTEIKEIYSLMMIYHIGSCEVSMYYVLCMKVFDNICKLLNQ